MRFALSLFAAWVLAVLSTGAAHAQTDRPGSADHPDVGRYEGSFISFHETKDYAEVRLPYRKLERADRDKPAGWQRDLAGKLISIGYEGPADRSALEILRNFEAALKAKGYDILFFCAGEEQCSPGRMIPTFWEAAKGGVRMPSQWGGSTYLLAEKKAADRTTTIGLYGIETKASGSRPLMPHVAVTVVEGKPMDTDRITLVEASEMEQALARDGRIAIYGIYFDFDRAELKPESRPQVEQLAALLRDRPQLSVLIVGHTDGKGAFDYNLSLSQRRAQAVVQALTSGFGIAGSRIVPAGAGMVAPVATNRTEEGRALNRRVEIVEMVRTQ